MKAPETGANGRDRTDTPKAEHFKCPASTNFTTFACMAGLTGLEPATSDVTGQHSNQLSYNPKSWKRGLDSNQRPRTYETRKLPTALPRIKQASLSALFLPKCIDRRNLALSTGLEPVTYGLTVHRSTD